MTAQTLKKNCAQTFSRTVSLVESSEIECLSVSTQLVLYMTHMKGLTVLNLLFKSNFFFEGKLEIDFIYG